VKGSTVTRELAVVRRILTLAARVWRDVNNKPWIIFLISGRKAEYSDGVWPGEKNKEDQVVVLNKVARSIIDNQRGKHSEYVFAYDGHRVKKIHTSSWKTAWRNAGLPIDGSFKKGPHNLKHTFGRRLRAVGVPLETRKVLLHHTNGDITSHYSGAELEELIEAVELIAGGNSRKTPTLTLIHKKSSPELTATA